jgi:hypothetical protein
VTVDAEWYLAEPAGWVPVPAASVPDVLDKRVVLAEPPGAFRYDMRAVSYPYTYDDGLVYVDVVSEHDWYRSRIRAEPVSKSRYPVDRVWVEYRPATPPPPAEPPSADLPSADLPSAEPAQPDRPPPGLPATLAEAAPATRAGSVFDRVVTTDQPPARPPRRAQDVLDLTGRRIVVLQPAGPVFHRRAVSEPYVDGASGDVSVTVCSEHDWYRWAITREVPRAESCPIYLVWVE